MKWDDSHKEYNKRTGRAYTVREAHFQDEHSAQTLRDIGGMRLTLREVGSERLLAIAKRNKGEWICTRWDFVEGERLPAATAYGFEYSKEAAIDFLLNRKPDVLPGMED